MKADWNDAPDYITRHPRKSRRLAKLIPGLIGTVITLAVLQMAGSAFLQGTAQRIAEKRIQPQPTPVAEITRAEPAATKDWDRVVEEVAARGATPQLQTVQSQAATGEPSPKQTVFNAKNYVPQGATNIVPATQFAPERSATIPAGSKEIVIIGKESRLRDLCPYREGSIERRNCKMHTDLTDRSAIR